MEKSLEHWQTLKSASGLTLKLKNIFAQNHFEPRTDPDVMLYDGFISGSDKAMVQRVNTASASDLAEQTFPFRDKRLPELLFRYRARNFPQSLNSAEQAQWREFCAERILQGVNGINGLSVLKQRIAELRPEQSAAKQAVLDDLLTWAEAKAQSLAKV